MGNVLIADDFVTYDQLEGPDLDAALWVPARLPLPTGDGHIPLDPNAELAVGEGEVRVTIPRFSLSHDTFQAADSPKYLPFSTRDFELAPDRPATFAVDLAVENIGGAPALIPERAHLGFGIWTMLPIRDGRSRSLDGQGMAARWRRFRVRE